ncbi:MAG: hypothetical protein NVSMB38_24140 [Ktedonobacteraceae bacterium]
MHVAALLEVHPEMLNSSKKILRQDSQANFSLVSALYNEAERGDGRDLAENGYSPTSILRQEELEYVQLTLRVCH